jgi:hypothetical protein
MGDRLVEQRQRVAHRPLGGANDQRQRIRRDPRLFARGDFGQMGQHHLGLHPAQVETLAARQDRDRHLADFGGGKQEFHMLGRFLQRLQQRVEGVGRQHVDLVDDVDLVARRGGAIGHTLDDLADVADPGAAGGVHLQHIDMAALGDRHAGIAAVAGFGGRARPPVGTGAVQPLGHDPRGRRLAHAAHTGQDEGMCDPVGIEGVLQRPHHRVLTDQVGKPLRAVFAGKHPIGRILGFGHRRPRSCFPAASLGRRRAGVHRPRRPRGAGPALRHRRENPA